jgi:medium-chain acyl-[acyl-carrier-protein] hydrolase
VSLPPHSPAAPDAPPATWRERLIIRSYDVDFHKLATAEAVCRLFLEAAWNHAEHLGFGYAALAAQSKLWVLSRLLVQIDSFPGWGQPVELTTWPRGINGVFALRDFELHADDGSRLAAGASSWLVLDATSHRPQRVDKLLLPIATPGTRAAVGREPLKLAELAAADSAYTAAVRYSDIDVNRHVNSARYIGWLLDSYPPDFLRRHRLQSLEVNYLGEGLWTDTLTVRSGERRPLLFNHSIAKANDSEVCRAELLWAPTAEPPPVGPTSAA